MIAVCVCSRGLVHSRTADSIEWNRRSVGIENTVLLHTHDKRIPDAQNQITLDALEIEADFIWYVEEDVSVPNGTLRRMFYASEGLPVVADYNVRPDCKSIRRDALGNILFSGMGCMLVPASVFSRIPFPWFDTKSRYISDDRIEERSDVQAWGGQDVSLYAKFHDAGIRVVSVPIECEHLRFVGEDPFQRVNSGCFNIISI